MRRIRILLILFIISTPAFAGTGRAAQVSVVKNLVAALNYNRYEQFIRDGSPDWRKKMTRSKYNKLHTQMINYIGHIVSWKPVSKHSNGKIDTYIYQLTGDTEAIGLIMRVQMYVYKNRLVVHNFAFSKR